jgi:DNA-binding CsgD family transcriptional regulator
MSSVQTVPESPTELRLDYKDIVAGRLVIVIHGLPGVDDVEVAPEAGRATAAPADHPSGMPGSGSSSPLTEEAAAVDEAVGDAPMLLTPLLLAAWKGRELLVSELIAATVEGAAPGEAARAAALADYAKAVLCNGLGRYDDAVAAARRARAHDDLGVVDRASVELVEAAARSGRGAIAADALRQLEQGTHTGAERALGAWARSAALLSDGAAAEALYREALERFDHDRTPLQLARARLVYGEWLRRENRRLDAREQLRVAHETLGWAGAEAFAERAHRELLATGETARRRRDETRDILTPQEAQIARLARDGFSNPEIGAQLYISHRTVQYHLRKVFAKLGITSRNQLVRVPASSLQST